MQTTLNKKGLLGRQTHLLRHLHQDRMANELIYTITIDHRLSSINDNSEKCLPCLASSWCGNWSRLGCPVGPETRGESLEMMRSYNASASMGILGKR